jgi:RHS repeat-associated protein
MEPTCLANESESVVHALDYYPYGDQRISTGATSTSRQYIGERYDSDTDLNYLNARYYQSTRGQFLSEDPVFWENPKMQNMMNPQSLNSYAYANGNPITTKDPLGLWAVSYNLLSGSVEGGLRFGGAGSFNAGFTFVGGRDGGLAFTTSYGGVGALGQRSVGYPSSASVSGISNLTPFVLGSSVSAGCGIPQCGRAFQPSGSYSSTVDSLSDLGGPANSINGTIPFASFSQQTDMKGNRTYTFGAGGFGRGASVSTYPVQNTSYTIFSNKGVINTASDLYSSTQASYQSAVSRLQAQYNSLKTQVDKLVQSRNTKSR